MPTAFARITSAADISSIQSAEQLTAEMQLLLVGCFLCFLCISCLYGGCQLGFSRMCWCKLTKLLYVSEVSSWMGGWTELVLVVAVARKQWQVGPPSILD